MLGARTSSSATRRQARAICSQGKIVSRFALSADGDVRAPGRMRLPNSENCITNPTSRAAMIVSLLSLNFLRWTLVRYDSADVTQSDRQMEGQLSEHPLAELIREISNTGLSGALRLSHERAKAVVYFETGNLLFATSNLRAHRLREVLKRNSIADQKLQQHSTVISDEELATEMIKSGEI